MADWNNDNPNTVDTFFDIKMTEDIKDYIIRLSAELKSHEEVMKKRIEQQFRDHVTLNINKTIPKDVYDKALAIFNIGYQLGWNDYFNLTKEDRE